jgi:hypothetical protein
MSTSHITINGRKVHLVDTGGDTKPKVHLVWLGQISPDFIAVLGGSEDEAHEAAADAIDFPGLSHEEVSERYNECLIDCDHDEYAAWEAATAGMLDLNGGEKWIDSVDWGFWNADKQERGTIRAALLALRNSMT